MYKLTVRVDDNTFRALTKLKERAHCRSVSSLVKLFIGCVVMQLDNKPISNVVTDESVSEMFDRLAEWERHKSQLYD